MQKVVKVSALLLGLLQLPAAGID